MFDRRIDALGTWALVRLGRDPFGLQVFVARAVLALGTFLTLVCNPAAILLHSGDPSATQAVSCVDVGSAGAFCIAGGGDLDTVRLVLAIFCLPTILGIVPAVSGWLHAYAAFSLSSNAIGIEGGDQLTVTLAILLSVASLTDRRLTAFTENRRPGTHVRFVLSNMLLWVCTIQVAYVYVEAALVKLGHPIWAEGTALWYWAQNSGFGVSKDGESLLLDLLAAPVISAAATWGTMILELVIAAFLVFGWRRRRLRLAALVLGLGFHLVIAAVMGLVTFFIAMTGALVISCWRPRDGYPLRLFRRLRRTALSTPGRKPTYEGTRVA
ncbi:HTTM domain-containing protein [Leifsonia shinshuensis]|uniref:Antimicrobial peptide system SdpB family protein n=1 Tax=Leifsonia shinshuensis TaxID=150026 RepID=A0A853CYE9_9MICO|nr:HTTM domain-containing protein [Leifsonia shinshuensis]NYJ23555.1 antimicrobial peptide system SdpB family protein [Leifsonia shinshuensis]